MFGGIKRGIAEAIVDGGMYGVKMGQKIDQAESSMLGGFNSFVDKRVINRANAARNALDSGVDTGTFSGNSRVVMGNMLNKTAGGAILGGIGNGALYSNTNGSVDGSFSVGEAIVGGIAGGAAIGAGIGAMTSKAALATARSSRAGLQKRYDKAMNAVSRRGLLPFGSGKEMDDGYVMKLNDGADLSNRKVTMTHGISGPGNSPRIAGPDNRGGNPSGLGVNKVPSLPYRPGGGGAMLQIPHAQNNMNTVQVPTRTAAPAKVSARANRKNKHLRKKK